MKSIKIPKISIEQPHCIEAVAKELDVLNKNHMLYVPWQEYPYKPRVSFTIAYSGNQIFVKYFVEEKQLRAVANEPNGAVWEDSCVEFFVSFNNEKAYYNFEFNCIGTCLAGYGSTKENRVMLSPDHLNNLKTYITIVKNDEAVFKWELTVAIPVDVLVYTKNVHLEGSSCRANFYKCGDMHKEPHFVTWSYIESPTPNFHLPDYFGKIQFCE